MAESEDSPPSTNSPVDILQEPDPQALDVSSTASSADLTIGHPSNGHTTLSDRSGDNKPIVDKATLARVLLAATLVRDAKSNRFIHFRTDAQSLRYYQLYYNPVFKWFQYFFIFILLSLVLFEKPAVWEADFWVTAVVEIVCLIYLTFRVVHQASFQHKTDFFKDRKNIVAVVLILASGVSSNLFCSILFLTRSPFYKPVLALSQLCFLDVIIYSLWMKFAPLKNPVRWSRPLRPLFVINFPHARQIRRAFRNIRRTLLEIIFVLILFFFSILLFSLLALKLFGNKNLTTKGGEKYFDGYLDAMWSLYVLVTTANNPDVMMPAYDSNNWYSIFFIFFLVINLYIFMNVLLAVIFNSYKKHLKNEVKATVFAKRRKLADAFELVKQRHGRGYYLKFETWRAIAKIIAPKRSELQVRMLFQVMDSDSDGCLTKADFMEAADLLNMPLTEIKDRMIIWERLFPRVYNCGASMIFREVILHKAFRYFFDFAILVNAVCIALDLKEAEWFFLALFTLEILLKIYAYGIRGFIQFWNIFDVAVIGGAMIATIVEAATDEEALQSDTLDFILVLRVLRLIKIVNGIERFRIVIMTLVNIGPSIVIYGGVLFTFYYSFAVIGMEIFQGRITYYGYNETNQPKSESSCGNMKLAGSEFYNDHYCSNNFNNVAKAFVVLTELTVVNQWHVLTKGFVAVTHEAVKLYFLFFHLTVVVLVMNIFIAFILEAFILEYSLSKSKFESKLEAKILKLGYGLGQKNKTPENPQLHSSKRNIVEDIENNELGQSVSTETCFHVKQNKKKVEVLLQRMFEDELDPEDLGSEEDLDGDVPRSGRAYTLDGMVSSML